MDTLTSSNVVGSLKPIHAWFQDSNEPRDISDPHTFYFATAILQLRWENMKFNLLNGVAKSVL